MQNIMIINELIKQGRGGTHDLYSKIPFFLRTRLDGIISKQLWTRVNEGCQLKDPHSLECARTMYKHVLQAADEYVNAYAKKSGTDNCILMKMAKNDIIEKFEDDPAAFVLEMDKCLQRERELIFTYQEKEQAEPEMAQHNEDITDQDEDGDITLIESLTQEVNIQLLQAKSLIEELVQYYTISQQLVGSLTQDDISESLEDEAADHIRHYTAEFENLQMNHEQTASRIVGCKQSAVNGMTQLSLLCLHYTEKLTRDLETWKIAEAKRSVKVGPKTNTGALLNKTQRFGAAINTVLTWFANNGIIKLIRDAEQSHSPDDVEFVMEVGRIQMNFQAILKELVQLVVTVQPKGVISIENKGKKDSPNYCTKKTQPFTSTVRVLAGESFPNFHILSKSVELVAERDLAQGSNAEVVGRDGFSCLKVEASNGNTLPEINFNIQVKNFCRVEQNNVYKQFFRLVYTVKVSVHETEYSLKTMSLPFTFNTGANQILEHMGARMWYCASVRDLYNGGFQCPDPLSADEVINILDNRVAFLGNKTRRLTADEKTFLRGRLPVASDDTVTMQGFLKDKMKTLRSEDILNYSFYTWFYSVIHTFELLLLDAWQDRIIYGFCSEKTAAQLLMEPNVPEGTIILRPSISEIQKTSSADATAALVMEVKLRKDSAHLFDGHSSEFEVSSVPLFYNHIEKNTLYGAIKGIVSNKKPIAKFLYGKERGKELKVLKGYVKKQEDEFYPEYRMLMQKFEKINIRRCTKPTVATEDTSDGEDDSGREPNKRKRRHRKSSSSTQIQSNSQSPPLPGVAYGSPSGSASLPVFTSLTTGEIKQENPQHMQFQSGGAVTEQCQRSGTQGKTIAGTIDEDTVNRNIGQEENGEVEYGALKVDISNIALIVASKHGQNSYPAANGSGIMGMEVNGTPPPRVQYTTQSHENGINSFMNPASSPEYVYITDQSTMDSDFPMHNFTPASVQSSFSESFPSSPGSTQMSPPRADMQIKVNLPTVLKDAKECKRQVRRQGGSKGNSQSNSSKKSASSRSTVKPVVQIPHGSHSSTYMVNNLNLQNQTYAVAESYTIDLEVDNSLSQGNTLNFDNLDIESTQLFANMLQQRVNLQWSPDSGVGDQSPSPELIWNSHPLSNSFQIGSDTFDATNLPHV